MQQLMTIEFLVVAEPFCAYRKCKTMQQPSKPEGQSCVSKKLACNLHVRQIEQFVKTCPN